MIDITAPLTVYILGACVLEPMLLVRNIITQYGSTVYIGIAMVFVFPPYIREIQFLLSVSSQFDF